MKSAHLHADGQVRPFLYRDVCLQQHEADYNLHTDEVPLHLSTDPTRLFKRALARAAI